jgi:hypothetical protein
VFSSKELNFFAQRSVIPFADGKSLYEAYAGPKWHYWVENASHDRLRERAPLEYRRRLCAFFNAMLANSQPVMN